MIDQSQFLLLSGDSSLDCLSTGDFATVISTLESRLFNALCLTEEPTIIVDDETVVDPLWNQLLADALAVSVDVKSDDGIESENMRNYSYRFRDYANSWTSLALKSGDLINKFNACDSGIVFQRDDAEMIYGSGEYDRDESDEYI